jgi:hypothetical protein
MKSYLYSVAFCIASIAAIPASAGIADMSADGTWDCRTDAGEAVVTVVVADTTYAVLTGDGAHATYGTLHPLGDEIVDTPYFIVPTGYLKDELKVMGVTMQGPRGHSEDLSGEVYLVLILGEDNLLYCTGRKAPST